MLLLLIDVLVIALVVLCAYHMYKKGVFIGLVDLAILFAVLYVARLFCLFLQAPLAALYRPYVATLQLPPELVRVVSRFGADLPMLLAYCTLLVILAALFSFLVKPLARLINIVFKLPVLKQINRLLGGLLGIGLGVLLAYFAFIVIIPSVQAAFFPGSAPLSAESSIVFGYVEQFGTAAMNMLGL